LIDLYFNLDGYKLLIDECGISGSPLEDPAFPPEEKSIGIDERELKNMAPMEYQRISQIP
jgi:hypothetical protein